MQHGKRESQWNYFSALIVHMRLCAGDKNAKKQNFNPYVDQPDDRAKFKKLIRGEKRNESNDLQASGRAN